MKAWKKSFLFSILTIYFFAQAQEKPEWAKDLPNLPDKPGFYQGLGKVKGSGDVNADWQKAANQVRAEISAQIRVRIVNTLTREIKEVSRDGQRRLDETFQSTTEQITEGTLEGLLIERWFDKNEDVYYAYASISKKEIESKLDESFRSVINSASQCHRAARQAIDAGDIYFAMTRYLDAAKIVFLGEVHLSRAILGDIDGSGAEKPALAFLQNELSQLLRKVRFEIVEGNNQLAEKGRALNEQLVGRVVLDAPTGSIPIKNAILVSSFMAPASGKLIEECHSDEEGKFEISVNEIVGGEATNSIRVTLALKGIESLTDKMPEAVHSWKDACVDFSFRLRVRTNVKIAMQIVERNLGKLNVKSTIQEEIQKALLGDRYAIVEESQVQNKFPLEELNTALESGNFDAAVKALSSISDFVIVGVISTKERSNPASGMFFSTASATIRVIDSKTGRIIASAALDNEKEGGNSYEVASMKALQRIGKQIGEEIKASLDTALQ